MSSDAQRAPTGRRTARKITASTTRGGAPAQERKLRTQGRETLRKLLDAGMVVFDRRGYHAARVDDIVKVARTSHGTFYLYFANKEDLFWALLSDVSEEMIALSASLGAVSPGRKGYDDLRTWLDRFVELYTRFAPVIRAWTEAETDTTEMGAFGTDLLSRFARRLGDRIREVDSQPGLDPDIASLAMVALIERFSYYVLTRSVNIDREQLLDTLATVLHVGVFGGARGRRPAAAGVGATSRSMVVPAG
jgi:AcrR family transcriptional regulator